MALVSPSYGLYATPQADPSITTVAQFNADAVGYDQAYARSEANGADHAYYILHWSDLMPTTETREWARFDRFVRQTATPIIFNLAVVDGSTKFYPSDIASSTDLDTTTVTAPLTTLLEEIAARTSRVVAIGFGNEIDGYLAGSAAARVAEYAAFLGTMQTAAETAFGADVHTYVSLTYHSVADGTYASNSYGTVATAGSYPVFTYYPTDASTFVVYDFDADTGGMADDFAAMFAATGDSLDFALQEAGCPTGATVTSGAPGGGGEGTQAAFYDTLTTLLDAYAGIGHPIKFCTALWQNDVSSAVWSSLDPAPTGNALEFLSTLGLVTTAGVDKAAYADLVTYLDGVIGSPACRAFVGSWQSSVVCAG